MLMFTKTYGCQMNVYDTMRMKDLMSKHGYSNTETIEAADLIVLNTCHIREKAAEKVYSELGRIKLSQKKKAIIVVAGCVSQAEGDQIFSRAHFVDIVVGPQSYHNLPELVNQVRTGIKGKVLQLEFEQDAKFDKLPEEFESGISGFVSIQEGCDKFCSFCVVPYTRGSEFSRPVEQIYREVLKLVSSGTKEVTLLGQNVSAYHGKTYDGSEINLAKLIKLLVEIKDLKRIRYTTSHPIDMDSEIIALHGSEPKLMPFLHLPVQSGSNNILKSMNRKYTREFYLDLISSFRRSRPDILFSSDFIVGFPGETDEDFQGTLDLVQQVRFSQCFSFKYSMRPGTPGAIRNDQVPEDIKHKRLMKLQEVLFQQQLEFNESKLGEVMPVLFTKSGKFEGQVLGKTPYMQSVHIKNPDAGVINEIVDVKITKAMTNSLGGILI
jgi:tRNA-2-methylthio-N6-dimethylallyladenosine synthase